MSKIQKLEEKQRTVRQILLKSQKQIEQALPRGIDPARMFRAYMTAIQLTPRLLDCEQMSLISGVIQAAQFGLSLDPILGESYLIPRWNSKVGSHVANFQLGYKGMRKLALQGDVELRDVYAMWVYQRDVFEFQLGDEPVILRHIPTEEEDPGPLRCAYAVAVWKDGYKRRHIMLGRDIRKVRDNSDGYKKAEREGTMDSPWHEWEQEMWRKTVLTHLFGQMQLASDNPLHDALRKDMEGSDVITTDGIVLSAVESVQSPPPREAPKNDLDAVADQAEAEEIPPASSGSLPEEDSPQPPTATRRRRS